MKIGRKGKRMQLSEKNIDKVLYKYILYICQIVYMHLNKNLFE